MKQTSSDTSAIKKMLHRFALWMGVIALLGLALYGIMRLGAGSRSGATVNGDATIPAVNAQDWTMGSSIAKLTLVEYSDFQCPACASYEPLLKELQKQYAGTVLFAYRHFPLPQHGNAMATAIAAEAAGKQGKFWPMHDLLFSTQNSWSNSSKTDELFAGYAGQLGLNVDQFKKDLSDPSTKAEVTADQTSGEQSGVNSTPTFFLDGKQISPNPINLEEFKNLIDSALVTK